MAAVIDKEVMCTHGGVPRPRTVQRSIFPCFGGGGDTRLEDLKNFPCPAGIAPRIYMDETTSSTAFGTDILWSDPVRNDNVVLNKDGFGQSKRGPETASYGQKALENFLDAHGFEFMIRAHEPVHDGVAISHSARLFTVFSTSKDHGLSNAKAGCVLVEKETITAINVLDGNVLEVAMNSGTYHVASLCHTHATPD
eukprot:GFYU01006850.1.p1 GENE.GFYU01006850.1~~GFYU01006850.1.p1  ORF type:complete len:196 (-),score=53.19 GFYU01006850.1:315-902(-)